MGAGDIRFGFSRDGWKEMQHAGIVWCSERKYSIGQLVRALALIHAVMDRAAMRDHVEFL